MRKESVSMKNYWLLAVLTVLISLVTVVVVFFLARWLYCRLQYSLSQFLVLLRPLRFLYYFFVFPALFLSLRVVRVSLFGAAAAA